MKTKTIFSIAICILFIESVVTSCSKDDDDNVTNSTLTVKSTTAVASGDEIVENTQNEVVSIADINDSGAIDFIEKSVVISKAEGFKAAKDTNFTSSTDKAKVKIRKRLHLSDRLKDTIIVVRDYSSTTTSGDDDYTKSGTITITHIGNPFWAGSKTTISFSGFSTNGNSVSGTIEKYRKFYSSNLSFKDSIVEKDLTVTVNDTTFVRNMTTLRNYYFANNSGVINDSIVITHSGNVKCEKLDLKWTKNTTTPLIRKYQVNKFRFLVSGVNTINVNKITESTLLAIITKTFSAKVSIPHEPKVAVKVENKITGVTTEYTRNQKR